ncbi:MAG: glycosyltransferase family 9 protein [Candidatus Brocadiia bacterium]
MRVAKKILVVKINMLGDMVTFLPMLNSLRKGMPDAEITLLTTSVGAELSAITRLVDNIWITSPGEARSIFWFTKLWLRIINKKFNISISSYDSSSFIGLVLYLSGIPVRIGYDCAKLAKMYNRLVHFSRDIHMIELNLNSIKELGLSCLRGRPVMNIPEDAKDMVDKILIKNGVNQRELIIGIHPGSRTAPRWSPEHFAKLADELIKNHHAKIICIGSISEKVIVDDIQSQMGRKIIDFTGQTTVAQLAYLISRLSILIGHSSGPTHLAYLMGTSTLSFWGVSLPQNWGPYWDKERHICLASDLDCLGCDKKECPKETLECMVSISVGKTLESIKQLLSK